MGKGKKRKLIHISLQEASKICNYSQEYLSLRARQGKLKSAKFGRNWVTTREWLEEYIKKSESYNSTHNGNGYRAKKTEERKIAVLNLTPPIAKAPGVRKITISRVPDNLPIEKMPILRFDFAIVLVLVLFLAGGFFGNQVSLKNISFSTQGVSQGFSRIATNINSENFSADLQGLLKEYFKWFAENINQQFAALKTRLLSIGNFFSKKSVAENKKEGMVVVSSTEENEAMKIKIQESFSDEVKVEPKDEGSGIITPVFKKGDGDQYFYIMVPIKN